LSYLRDIREKLSGSNGLSNSDLTDRDTPGGSAGDPRMFPVKMPKTLDELKHLFEKKFGYDAAHMYFFKRFLARKVVADLGCGYGFSTFYVSDECSLITGYDIDWRAIQTAKALKDRFGITNVDFVWHQPYKTNAPRKFYDVVISSEVLEHVHHPDLYLTEANSMCVNGGLLLLSTPNGLASRGDPNIIKRHSPFHVAEYTPFELQRLLQRAGFEILEIYSQVIAANDKLSNDITRVYLRYAFSDKVGPVIAHLRGVYSRWRDFLSMVKRGNKLDTWRIYPASLDGITASNCNAIILICRKINEL
jgi:2-polyprenyl-3-methyl-5-hydroxy-6-metoxy-1,4-benzoquinol methylase